MPVLGSDYTSERRRLIGFEGDQRNLLEQGTSQQLRILPFLLQQYGAARAGIGGAFDAARRSTNDQYRANLGNVAGRAGGLRNSTIAQNAILGAGAQRSRQLQDIAGQQGLATAGLEERLGQAGAGAMGDTAAHFLSRSQIENQLYQNFLRARESRKGRKAEERAGTLGAIGDIGAVLGEAGLAFATGGTSLAFTQGRSLGGLGGAPGGGPSQGAGRPSSYYQTFV